MSEPYVFELSREGLLATSSALGQASLAAAPLVLAVVVGLLDVLARNVVVPRRTHSEARLLLVLLLGSVVIWLGEVLVSLSRFNGVAEVVNTLPWFVGLQAWLLLGSVGLLAKLAWRFTGFVQRGVEL